MKAVKAHLEKTNPERVEGFMKGAQAFAGKVSGDFKNFQFVCSFRICVSYCPLTSELVHWREHEP
jgi:hypothetical protein